MMLRSVMVIAAAMASFLGVVGAERVHAQASDVTLTMIEVRGGGSRPVTATFEISNDGQRPVRDVSARCTFRNAAGTVGLVTTRDFGRDIPALRRIRLDAVEFGSSRIAVDRMRCETLTATAFDSPIAYASARGTPAFSAPPASPAAAPESSSASALLGLAVLALLAAIYFLPVIVAASRSHSSTGGIVVVTLFLGWTFLGWVVALAWAFSGRHDSRPA
jgi:hypothetical protein